jgi:FHA domain/GAF domain
MKALLLVTHGPSRGASATLDDKECGLGRDPSNRLFIPNTCLSAHHCVVRHESGVFKLVDLESKNGTLLNGKPIHEQLLQDGDRISVGDTAVTFFCRPDAAPDSVQLVGDVRTGTPLRLRPEETYYLNPAIVAAVPRSARRERDLHLLLSLATKIVNIRDRESLQWQILGAAFQGIPAGRGAVLLISAGSMLKSGVSWDRKAGPMKPVQVSREIAQQAISQRVGVLTTAPPNANKSTPASPVLSVICAPLLAPDGALGVIYLDTPHHSTRFDEQHLDLLTAIANLGAGGLKSISYMETIKSCGGQT